MNRRELFQLATGATLAAPVIAKVATAPSRRSWGFGFSREFLMDRGSAEVADKIRNGFRGLMQEFGLPGFIKISATRDEGTDTVFVKGWEAFPGEKTEEWFSLAPLPEFTEYKVGFFTNKMEPSDFSYDAFRRASEAVLAEDAAYVRGDHLLNLDR